MPQDDAVPHATSGADASHGPDAEQTAMSHKEMPQDDAVPHGTAEADTAALPHGTVGTDAQPMGAATSEPLRHSLWMRLRASLSWEI